MKTPPLSGTAVISGGYFSAEHDHATFISTAYCSSNPVVWKLTSDVDMFIILLVGNPLETMEIGLANLPLGRPVEERNVLLWIKLWKYSENSPPKTVLVHHLIPF